MREDGEGRMMDVPIECLRPSGRNVRRRFDEVAMMDLVESVRQVGILQPLLVVPDPERAEGHYLVVAGERRYRAAREAGLEAVPVVVRNLTEDEISEVVLIENLQRQDLDPIEEASGYRDLLATGRYTQERLAERLGVSQGHVANRVRLLRLPESVQENISRKIIGPSHGLALLKLCPEGAEPSPLVEEAVEYLSEHPAREAGEAINSFIRMNAKSLQPADKYDREGVQYRRPSTALFNLSECKACSYRTSYNDWDNKSVFACINPPCWEKRQDRAYNEARQAPKRSEEPSGPSHQEDAAEREERRQARLEETRAKVEKRLATSTAAAAPETSPAREDLDTRQLWEAKRLRDLATLHWASINEGDYYKPQGSWIFDLEFFLDLATLLEHFDQRVALGASKLPAQFGGGDLRIPSQGLTVRYQAHISQDEEFRIILDPLTFKWRHATVTESAPLGPVYYRAALSDDGGKWLCQAAVVPCRGRDVIITSSASITMRRDLIPRWAELLAGLPAFPDVEEMGLGRAVEAGAEEKQQTA